jgi:outer membrane receptor protein involved in Fe transport
MSKTHGWRHCLWLAPLTFTIGTTASAQEPSASDLALDEVVVTARKREETLQDVPLAVTAISVEQLERRGVQDVEGIIQGDPSLGFDLGIAPYDTRIVVRGLSPTRGRPNVATLVDGIDVSSEAIGVAGGSLLINPRLVDIERIEVVKGPQSALYGRSAFAGAIQYITSDPGKEASGAVSIDMNQKEQKEFKAHFSLPLGDTLGVRLNGYVFDEPGVYENFTTGQTVGGGKGQGGSLTLKWEPNEVYSLKFRSEYSDDEFDVPAQAAVPFNGTSAVPAAASSCRTYSIANPNVAGATPTVATAPILVTTGPVLDASCLTLDANPNLRTAAGVPITGSVLNVVNLIERATGSTGVYDDMSVPSYRGVLPDARSLRVTYNPDYGRSRDNGVTGPDFSGTNRQVLRLSAVQGLSFEWGTITSLTGYTRADVSTEQDFDKTDSLVIQQTLRTDNRTEQFSQELRFTSDFDGPLQIIGGAQYWTERADQFDRNNSVFGRGAGCTLLTIVTIPGMNPSGVCAPFGANSLTSTSVAPFMDDVFAARVPFFTRRLVDHSSAYLEFEWDFTDSLRLIGEARYVDEDNEISARVTAGSQGPGTAILCGATGNCNVVAGIPYPAGPPPAMGTFAGPTQGALGTYTRSEDYVTPKATLQWRPSSSLNIYGSYSEGRKPGGFATLTTGAFGLPPRPDVEFESEKIAVYELGGKWASENRRVSLNGAYFFQDFTDKQVSTQVIIGNTLGNRVTNAGGAQLQGFEFSGQWRASERLTVTGGLTHFFEYEYTSFDTLTSGAAELARTGNCTPVVTAVSSVVAGMSIVQAQATCSTSRTGNFLEDTPETAVALNLSYRAPFGTSGKSWFVDLDTNWIDERFAEDDNTILLDSYLLANLRFGLESEQWTAILYIDNLTDDDTIKSGGTGPGNVFADVRAATVTGGASALLTAQGAPANLRSSLGAFGLGIPTGVFANLPAPRLVGLRFNYKF